MEIQSTLNLVLVIISILAILGGGITYIVRWCFSTSLRLERLENSINELPNKIDSSINKVELSIISSLLKYTVPKIEAENNPLSKEEIKTRNYLLNKLENSSISKDEARELEKLLKIEEKEAREKSKWDLLLPLGIALIALALILSSKD